MSTAQLNRDQILPLLSSMQNELDNWYATSQAELNNFQRRMNERIERARSSGNSPTGWEEMQQQIAAPKTPTTPPPQRMSATSTGAARQQADDITADADWSVVMGAASAQQGAGAGGDGEPSTPPVAQHRDAFNGMMTPTGSPQANDRVPLELLISRISAANNAPPLNFDSLIDQLTTDSPNEKNGDSALASALGGPLGGANSQQSVPMESLMQHAGQAQTASVQLSRIGGGGRPTVLAVDGAQAHDDDPKRYKIDPASPCQALVEFKRKRVLQYDSRHYVAPGEYVVVGGDRGEDLGLVIYTWCETTEGKVQGIGLAGSSLTRSIGVGSGKVLRVATPFEVSQLHGIQTELERRAIDVCQQRVLDHGLPMVIVDAEYQFDNKKLTFFYEAQQRLDFRELVRDLFKTFRARIWMELATRE